MSPSTSQPSSGRGQGIDGRGQRTRVGVVAVVHQHRAIAQLMGDLAARHRLRFGQAGAISARSTPAASARLAAASALLTLWRPGRPSTTRASPSVRPG
jgi:hypothetical protein